MQANLNNLSNKQNENILGACRALGIDSEKEPQRGQFLPDLQAHSPAMGQKAGEKWTAAALLQPMLPKSDRLLGYNQPGRAVYLTLRYQPKQGIAL